MDHKNMDHIFNDRFGLDEPPRQQAKPKTKRQSRQVGDQQQAVTPPNSRNGSQKSSTRLTQASELDTPCRQIAKLNIRQQSGNSVLAKSNNKQAKQKKTHKLLGSKSLTQLIPKSLFLRGRSTCNGEKKAVAAKQQVGPSESRHQLATTRSFPNGAFYFDPMDAALAEADQDESIGCEPTATADRVNSISLIGLPSRRCRQSIGSSSRPSEDDNGYITMTSAGLSPIGGCVGQNELMRKVVASTPTTLPFSRSKLSTNSNGDEPADKDAQEQKNNGTDDKPKPSSKYRKPFRNTALVLRDVKNSIGLRMKAKQESKAFAKLTNEVTTPPTKLYSPFNIYSPSECSRESQKQAQKEFRSKRRLSLGGGGRTTSKRSLNDSARPSACTTITTNDSGNCSQVDSDAVAETPKGRIVLRHKKHLIQTNNAFTFDSPTGRLRETVKDVEQFQQCIENISRAIRTRNLARQETAAVADLLGGGHELV